MGVIQWFVKMFHRKKKLVPRVPIKPCLHEKPTESFRLSFRGRDLLWKDLNCCPACALATLEQISTTCAICKEAILPGEPVAVAPVGSKHPYTDLSSECCVSGILWCGTWGEGELIPLNQVDPQQFPAGTCSVASHVMTTGETVIRNIP